MSNTSRPVHVFVDDYDYNILRDIYKLVKMAVSLGVPVECSSESTDYILEILPWGIRLSADFCVDVDPRVEKIIKEVYDLGMVDEIVLEKIKLLNEIVSRTSKGGGDVDVDDMVEKLIQETYDLSVAERRRAREEKNTNVR